MCLTYPFQASGLLSASEEVKREEEVPVVAQLRELVTDPTVRLLLLASALRFLAVSLVVPRPTIRLTPNSSSHAQLLSSLCRLLFSRPTPLFSHLSPLLMPNSSSHAEFPLSRPRPLLTLAEGCFAAGYNRASQSVCGSFLSTEAPSPIRWAPSSLCLRQASTG